MNYFEINSEETRSVFSPLCSGPVSDDEEDEEVTGSCTSTACAGTSGVVKEADDEEEGAAGDGPQTLSVILVPGVSSTSP